MSENTTSTPLVSIITINYNQSAVTCQLLDSLQHVTYPSVETIVVDNASPDDTPEIIAERHPWVTMVRSPENLGFAGGNNLGVLHSKGQLLLFLNNDTEVEPGFLEPLVDVWRQHPDAGMISPRIIFYFSEGRNTIQYAGAHSINPVTGRGSKIGFMETDTGQYDETRPTDYCHGAAVMVPLEVIRTAGLMPDLYFLYYEEHDWGEMIKRRGYSIYYCGSSRIFHKESMSTGENSPLKTYYMTRNRIIFMKRNRSRAQYLAFLLFFIFLSVPKNVLRLSRNREWDLLRAFGRGCRWHLERHRLQGDPVLAVEPDGSYRISRTPSTS
ncbi:MAG: glycosyltransferase family 2 protein [Prosthecochloris sp.]|nr:glycosyltransferase family 2 protein [Prosthecochloris sp.]